MDIPTPDKKKTLWDTFSDGEASRLQENISSLNALRSSDIKSVRNTTAYKLVIDVNYMWDEISRHIRKRQAPTFLQELSLSKLCEFHAPLWLLDELKNSILPKLAKHHRISPRELMALFDEFIRPQIKFHIGYKPAWHLSNGDPKDIPYTMLSKDIGALGVISQDSDIEKLLTRRIDQDEVSQFIQLARLENGVVQVKFLGVISMNFSVNSVAELAKATPDLVRKIPKQAYPWMLGAGVLGAWYFTQTEVGRRQAKAIGKAISPALKAGGEFILEGVQWTMEKETKAMRLRQSLEQV